MRICATASVAGVESMAESVNITVALGIRGFMSAPELEQLATWALRYYDILEIGSYMGRSTRALADNTGGTVMAIDDFNGLRENTDNPPQEDIRGSFLRNLRDHILSGKVTPIEANHSTRLPIRCDMCFIDGSHDYESVRRDIGNWSHAKLLCGHDFDSIHPDVMRAVDELVPGYRVIPGTSLWWREL